MIIAIDGPAGSGKSSVARRVAERLGFHYLDTGAMYRAVAFRALVMGVRLTDEARVGEIAERSRIDFAHEPGEAVASKVLIDGEDVTAAIRAPQVDDAVSAVASLPRVREAMVAQQRRIAECEDVVIEGRDIGTVVFPEAELKIFLTATPEERSRRRAAQQAASGHLVDPAGVRESILKRDHADSTRSMAPLTPADDARVIDTTGLSLDEVVAQVCAYIEVWRL